MEAITPPLGPQSSVTGRVWPPFAKFAREHRDFPLGGISSPTPYAGYGIHGTQRAFLAPREASVAKDWL